METSHKAGAERDRRLRSKLHQELGPAILAALDDDKIVEVMINADGSVWADRLGSGVEPLSLDVTCDQAESLVSTVAAVLGATANPDHPIVEGELPFFGYRFEGIVAPVSPRPAIAIRKHGQLALSLDDYVERGDLALEGATQLRSAIKDLQNIVVAGGTGSGKTTLVNALLHEKVKLGRPNQRLVILEDTVEIRCDAANQVQLRTSDVVDLTRLVRATMRLRPDAIIVGEVRGREALDMLKAWNTGHPGGLTTVHANSARAALSRLDQLVQEAGVPSQPHLLGDAVDLIVGIRDRAVQELLRVHRYEPSAQRFELEVLPS